MICIQRMGTYNVMMTTAGMSNAIHDGDIVSGARSARMSSVSPMMRSGSQSFPFESTMT